MEVIILLEVEGLFDTCLFFVNDRWKWGVAVGPGYFLWVERYSEKKFNYTSREYRGGLSSEYVPVLDLGKW